jgi:sec-independent protein translocase protein TatA
MFGRLGTPELLIVLVIVVLLFGGGKIGKIGGEIGTAMREFRQSMQADETVKKEAEVSIVEPSVEGETQPEEKSEDQ